MDNNENKNNELNFFNSEKENIEFVKSNIENNNTYEQDNFNIFTSEENQCNFSQELQKRNINLNSISNTLPGIIIFYMIRFNTPLDEKQLYDIVFPKFPNLRKPNGAKYKNNLRKALKSTLSSTGLFTKNTSGKFFINEIEGIEYIERVFNKQTNIQNIKEKKQQENLSKNLLKRKRCIRTGIKTENSKFIKVFNILDDLLSRYKDFKDTKPLQNPFKNINNKIDLLHKVDDNKCLGILICFKFFKNIINKFIKFANKKKKKGEIIKIKVEFSNIFNKLDMMDNKIDSLGLNLNKSE